MVGSSAIGPFDDDEAHGLWEAIELHDKTLEELIADHMASDTESRFEVFVRTLDLARRWANAAPHLRKRAKFAEQTARDNPVAAAVGLLVLGLLAAMVWRR